MPSYVITGVSRGLGWEFLKQTSDDNKNTVIGLVRDKASTEKRVAEELGSRQNVKILEADITDYASLQKAATNTAAITGGGLDYLIANAGYIPTWDEFSTIGELATTQRHELAERFHKVMDTNVLGNINLYSLFIPMILKGSVKKVVCLSSGLADLEPVRAFEVETSPLYSSSKAAMNMINAKFSAQYKKDGILFLSISPGVINTKLEPPTPEQMKISMALMVKFQQYAPHFKGPSSPSEAVRSVLNVVEKSSLDNGDGGAFLSHHGNKEWL
ncbi:uncharacterized protein E0L32_002967 [Thyridium curvatum]|uniref:NAD(P)-binding protein n=1 Tax=Thyridium curvatum TaxID=1093900 RepID=A0A507BEW7_9PEZI|nr:uncharacterized protein E0L32_002967 [Thyridium curvatum]TPX17866.1 hypothetical protein E0L32_002967 [Thyridium curvatum]